MMNMEKIKETIKTTAIIAVVYLATYIVVYCMTMLLFGLIMIISNRSDEIIDKCKKMLSKMQESIKCQIHKISGKTKKYIEPDTRSGIWYNWR